MMSIFLGRGFCFTVVPPIRRKDDNKQYTAVLFRGIMRKIQLKLALIVDTLSFLIQEWKDIPAHMFFVANFELFPTDLVLLEWLHYPGIFSENRSLFREKGNSSADFLLFTRYTVIIHRESFVQVYPKYIRIRKT